MASGHKKQARKCHAQHQQINDVYTTTHDASAPVRGMPSCRGEGEPQVFVNASIAPHHPSLRCSLFARKCDVDHGPCTMCCCSGFPTYLVRRSTMSKNINPNLWKHLLSEKGIQSTGRHSFDISTQAPRRLRGNSKTSHTHLERPPTPNM